VTAVFTPAIRVSNMAGSVTFVNGPGDTFSAADSVLANLPAGDFEFRGFAPDGVATTFLIEVCTVADLHDKIKTGRLFDVQLPAMLERTMHGGLLVFGHLDPRRQHNWTESTLVKIGEDWRGVSGGWAFHRCFTKREAIDWTLAMRAAWTRPPSTRRAPLALHHAQGWADRPGPTALVFSCCPGVGVTRARALEARFPKPVDALLDQPALVTVEGVGRETARNIVTTLAGESWLDERLRGK
jgi:hypothetical protein